MARVEFTVLALEHFSAKVNAAAAGRPCCGRRSSRKTNRERDSRVQMILM
jgi:hypothetical protein